MTTRIGLISDVHACVAPLKEALSVFQREDVATVLCAGDIAGYGTQLEETVELLAQTDCVSIMGNHDAWYLDSLEQDYDHPAPNYLSHLPGMWESVVEGIHIYAAHASPAQSLNRGIRLLDEEGRIISAEKGRWADELRTYPFDVLIVGHTHQVFAERLGNKFVINPGSTKFNHACAILSLPEMSVRIIPLSGREPIKSWNWGMMTRNEVVGSKE